MIEYIGVKYGNLTEDTNGIINTAVEHTFFFDDGESPVDIHSDSNVPAKNSQHPAGKGLYALTRSVSGPQEGDGLRSGKYIVTVQYTNDLRLNNTEEGTTTEVAPWKLPPYDISIFPVDVTKSFIKGYDSGEVKGSPSIAVLNPAGDPFDAQTIEQNTVYRFSYNLRDFNDSWINDFSDTVNDGDIVVIDKTIPKQKGRMRNVDSTFQRVYDSEGAILYRYWKVSIEIEKSADIWQVELMNLGLWFLEGAVKKRIYTDGDGDFGSRDGLIDGGAKADDVDPVDTPQKLEVDGSILTPEGSDATYTAFNQKAIINWQALSLPASISGQTATPRVRRLV